MYKYIFTVNNCLLALFAALLDSGIRLAATKAGNFESGLDDLAFALVMLIGIGIGATYEKNKIEGKH